MTPPPIFSPLLARGFEAAFAVVRGAGLSGVSCSLPKGTLPPDRPVLLYGNHASNWDGFLYRQLQKKLRPGVPIYSLMLERELRRLPLFRGLGGIGIDPESRASIARALRSTSALRARRDDFFFTVFPQGGTWPSSRRPLGFQPGILSFARALAPVTLLPVALHFELLGSLRPRAFVVAGEPIICDEEPPALADLEARVTRLLDALNAGLCAGGEAFARGAS